MSKYIKLTDKQKDEIRRLTQLANRRIKAAERAYSKKGMDIIPHEIAGPFQTKDRWATKSTPISRSVKFESDKAYKEQLKLLRSFDPKATRLHRPGIKEYTEVQRDKIALATSTALGEDFSYAQIKERLSKLSAPELSEFWIRFSDNASEMGMQYSSEAVMQSTFVDLYKEDLYSTISFIA